MISAVDYQIRRPISEEEVEKLIIKSEKNID